ncbi:hypothetical protein P4O66_018358 [Electrophorus voltai]|uniref:Uncharacterized protein n=1 Tax=Electrophorus voltai TaxID=2609070 RepID=A0AAD9DLL3_9TELE|nr:hypothetical protein P4O66_018358 [Electrophorus voltai]
MNFAVHEQSWHSPQRSGPEDAVRRSRDPRGNGMTAVARGEELLAETFKMSAEPQTTSHHPDCKNASLPWDVEESELMEMPLLPVPPAPSQLGEPHGSSSSTNPSSPGGVDLGTRIFVSGGYAPRKTEMACVRVFMGCPSLYQVTGVNLQNAYLQISFMDTLGSCHYQHCTELFDMADMKLESDMPHLSSGADIVYEGVRQSEDTPPPHTHSHVIVPMWHLRHLTDMDFRELRGLRERLYCWTRPTVCLRTSSLAPLRRRRGPLILFTLARQLGDSGLFCEKKEAEKRGEISLGPVAEQRRSGQGTGRGEGCGAQSESLLPQAPVCSLSSDRQALTPTPPPPAALISRRSSTPLSPPPP